MSPGAWCGHRKGALVALLVIPLVLVPLYSGLTSVVPSSSPSPGDPRLLEALPDLSSAIEAALTRGERQFTLPSGHQVTLTIDPKLQKEVAANFDRRKPSVGAFLAIDPRTGKVLALSGYRQGIGGTLRSALCADYPAASLMKIVTASAAIEELRFSPSTTISYRTGVLSLTEKDLAAPELPTYPSMTLTDALAKSANSVFGKVAAVYVGKDLLRKYLDSFHFDRSIPFELLTEVSASQLPEEDLEVARAGAGFGNIMLSPIHAVLLGASVANKGVMMRPHLVESIRDPQGTLVYVVGEESLGRAVAERTAEEIVEMMKATTAEGTLRKTFPAGRWRSFAEKYDIAGKTGTLSWGDPKLYYKWIVGIAPADNPTICIASLTGSERSSNTKTSGLVAREALAQYFGFETAVKTKKTRR